MKGKVSRIAAMLLAAVVAVAGLAPAKEAEAAGKPQFTVRTSAASTKPGDEITAEAWLEPGSDINSFVFNFTYDSNVYDCVKKTRGELGEEAIVADDPGSFSVVCDFDQPVSRGGKIYTLTLKVKDNASGNGNIGLEFKGATTPDGTAIPSGNDNADVSVKDENGNTIPGGNVVINVALNTIVLNKTAPFTMVKGAKDTLTVSGTPAGALVGKKVEWTSSDANVVKVDGNGNIEAVGGGKATVTASVEGKTASVEITVNVPLNAISLNKKTLELPKGREEKLLVMYNPADATEDTAITWISSDKEVALVDKEGKVTGIKAGTATITAETAKGLKDTCEVKVIEIPLTGIAIDSSNPAVVYKGQIRKITVALIPENTTDQNVSFTYDSSDEKVVTVDEDGMLHALKEGAAEITVATADGRFTTVYKVKVEEIPLKSIKFETEVTPLEVGKTAQLKILFNPADTTDDKTIVWSSSDETIATVENGLLKALKAGKTTITAKAGDKEASYELTVEEKKASTGNPVIKDNNNSTKTQVNKPGTAGTVKTGDTVSIMGVLIAMLLSLSVMAAAIREIRRKRVHR